MQLNKTNDFVRSEAAEEPAPQAFTEFLGHLKSGENTADFWNTVWRLCTPIPHHCEVL